MEVQDVLFELIETLDANDIPYAVMGGLAVRVYALPRPTQDVDLTVSLGPDRSVELLEIVERAGFDVPETYRKGRTDQVANMPLVKVGRYVGEHRIDVDIFLTHSKFQQSLMARRRAITLEDREIWLVSPEDLLLLKLAASRPRDKIDVQDLLCTLGDLDDTYLQTWANSLGLTQSLKEAYREFGR